MMMTPETPREALLLEQIALLQEQVRLLTEKTGLLEQHNAVLRLKVDAMARKLFGKSSEKLDPAQLQMVFDALKEGPDDVSKKDPPPVRPPATRRLRPRQRQHPPATANAKSARWKRSSPGCR